MGQKSLSRHELPRKLGWLDATMIVVGIVIGSGIFLLPNLIARNLQSRGAILAAWIISGLLSYLGALAYAELGAMLPATGGQYVYLREAYGPACAFVCGWTFMLAVLSGGIAFLAVSFSIYVAQFVHLTLVSSKLLALALIATLSAVNYVGVREGAVVQVTFTFLKIAGLVLLIGSAFLSPLAVPAVQSVAQPAFSLAHFGTAMIACLMAYNGWTYISFVAGEVKQPAKNLPRSLTLGMVVVMALYVLANVAYLKVMPISQIATTARVGAALAERTMGSTGALLVSLTVLISIVGAINGCILTAARIPFAQAQDGLFFRRFGRVHPRFETPGFAIVIQGFWTAVLVISGSYENLFSYSMVAAWIFYMLSVAAVFFLRRKLPDLPRPYRMWGYPYTLGVFMLVSVWFVANAFATEPRPSLMALGIIATGIPMYFIWRKPAPRQETPLEVKVEP
ncbi:MAG: amino acid permease [Terriglobia bacterium]|jgi:APA family basic amino acid/polyamine antiporter